MSAYLYATGNVVVTGRPCLLYSVIVTTDGGGPGKVILYDEKTAVAGREVAIILCPANSTKRVQFKGLELHRGLYMELVEKADYITIEWGPPESYGSG